MDNANPGYSMNIDIQMQSGVASSSSQCDPNRPLSPPLSPGNEPSINSREFGIKKETAVPHGVKLEVHCECETVSENAGRGRNLVVCIDGTANQFGFQNTNVVELYSRLEKDDEQLTYYNSGIGTFVKDSNWFGRTKQTAIHSWDMAVAWNLKRIVLNAYRWLSENYRRGDRIYLFGFSRGAYQVRIISGMIATVGLLHKGNDDQIAFAYELYLANINRTVQYRSWFLRVFYNEAKHVASMEKIRTVTARFKETLSHEHVTVHFVGVWDTVSSVGVTRGPSFPETVNGMTSVCGCRHAVSLDERRGKFLPEYVNGGTGPEPFRRETRAPRPSERMEPDSNRVKEVWFVGSHSDIGGGNSENVDLDKFGPSLRWMLYESIQYGLRVKLNVKGWGAPENNSSMTRLWRIMEIYPFRRLTYKNPDQIQRWPPHLAQGRRMQEGQLIHESVVRYMKKHPEYVPAAREPRDEHGHLLEWEKVRNLKMQYTPRYIEKDADSPALEILRRLRDAARTDRGITEEELAPFLELTTKLRGGPQSIIDAEADGSSELLFEALKHTIESVQYNDLHAHHHRVIDAIVSALSLFPSIPSNIPRISKASLQSWLRYADSGVHNKIVRVFGGPIHDASRSRSGPISSVACSADGRYIASGSAGGTIQLWDAETGREIGQSLHRHDGFVRSLSFSPDSTRIASGSDDMTVQIWDVSTLQTAGMPLTGHEGLVLSVAFSPDGKFVASGSADNTVRIWEAETGRAIGGPIWGDTGSVQCVAFSPDGRRILAGSGHEQTHIWDFETRNVVKIVSGQFTSVASLAFAPNANRVVSGLGDIKVLDLESGELVLGPLRGHEGVIFALAVSPDGRYIASGSDDRTVRVWNAETGEPIGGPLHGHTNRVATVAFSSDSKRVVSGSYDRTVMIWDVKHVH